MEPLRGRLTPYVSLVHFENGRGRLTRLSLVSAQIRLGVMYLLGFDISDNSVDIFRLVSNNCVISEGAYQRACKERRAILGPTSQPRPRRGYKARSRCSRSHHFWTLAATFWKKKMGMAIFGSQCPKLISTASFLFIVAQAPPTAYLGNA